LIVVPHHTIYKKMTVDEQKSSELVNQENNDEANSADIDIRQCLSIWSDQGYRLHEDDAKRQVKPIQRYASAEQMPFRSKRFVNFKRFHTSVSDNGSNFCKETHSLFDRMRKHNRNSTGSGTTISKANLSSRTLLAAMDNISGFSSRKRAFQNKSNRRKMMDRLDIPGWMEVADGNLEFFTTWEEDEILDTKAFDVNIFGPFGDCILHWALLQKQEAIAI